MTDGTSSPDRAGAPTPDNGGTWLDAWVSGMHEPKSTHLAMGSAIMGEGVMLSAMTTARDNGLLFHENGDTHLCLPAHCA